MSKVDDFMSKDVIFVTHEYRLDECMAIMSSKKVGHLPVLRDGEPVALISMRGVMEALVQDHEFLIEELTRYINGSHLSPNHKGGTTLSRAG
jgi:signal-transduction protein with cAMP-binding, CBS, and nucleotidyltransferase domain